jgi:hypothetical protein
MRQLPPPYQQQARVLMNLGYDPVLAMRAVSAAPFQPREQMELVRQMEQQNTVNQINRTKALIYPVR